MSLSLACEAIPLLTTFYRRRRHSGEILGKEKLIKKPGRKPGSVSDTKLPYSLSPRFSSIGSI
ncbi:TPA: hypothetical protein ACT19N_005931, partial [Raoultella planticola]